MSTFAVAICREGGRWQCDLLPPAVLDDLEHCIAALRQQPSEGGPVALLNVEDEFFVALRIRPDTSVALMLSDATAAVDWDLARQVAEFLGEDVPDGEDTDEIWPVGDLDLFADLGLPGDEMRMIVDNIELYADEMLAFVAGSLGCGTEFESAVETLSSR
ncbi:MAG: tRNA adenosine deaminase-associated protein [Geodermatophilaceae bacterium]|nr:tRNA adenosine deaminase-associated protein [Geodermatophilaceae bacterium]